MILEKEDIILTVKGEYRESSCDCLASYMFQRFARYPNAIAISDGARSLTYSQLEREVSKTAGLLLQEDLKSISVIGVIGRRSIELVVAILAVVRVGKTFLPIDDLISSKKFKFVTDDSKLLLALTTSEILNRDLKLCKIKNIPISLIYPAFDDSNNSLNDFSYHQDLPCYLIYTSGTTGHPKGVEVGGNALINFLESMQALLKLKSGDKSLFLSSISFDISLMEIFLPLAHGAQVYVADKAGYGEPEKIVEDISKSGVTLIQATPSGWQLLIQCGLKVKKGTRLISGGELLPSSLASQLKLMGGRLWNMYGPTETTIWVTAEAVQDPNYISIGQPINNTNLFIVNPSEDSLADKSVGELCIGGSALSNGYRSDSKTTDGKFIIACPNNDNISRIYRTGDLVKIRSDGELIFVGRIDRQIKIRGNRVELSEIDNEIKKDNFVENCYTVVKDHQGINEKIVSFVEISRSHRIPASKIEDIIESRLRSSLSKELPRYMLPAEFIFITRMPLNISGKIDVQSLESIRLPSNAGYLAPKTSTEIRLAILWVELLRIERVGLDCSFSALGGHSLLAARLTARIRECFDINTTMSLVIKNDKLTDMAYAIDQEINLENVCEPDNR